jgi:hypothetical protein
MLLAEFAEFLFPTLFFTAFTVFIAGMFYLQARREQRRRAERAQLAQKLGLAFVPKDTFGLLQQLKTFDLFSRERRWLGRNGKITNVMRGTVGDTQVYMFDYSYVISTGKSSRTIRQTVFFADDKNWFLPNFRLRPETWWHKVLAKIGAQSDISFPENPDFSDKFWVTGEFEQLTRQTFGADIQAFLSERPPTHLEGSNYYLLAYKPGKVFNADEARTFFDHCCKLVEVMKKEGGKSELLQLVELKKEEVALPVAPEITKLER